MSTFVPHQRPDMPNNATTEYTSLRDRTVAYSINYMLDPTRGLPRRASLDYEQSSFAKENNLPPGLLRAFAAVVDTMMSDRHRKNGAIATLPPHFYVTDYSSEDKPSEDYNSYKNVATASTAKGAQATNWYHSYLHGHISADIAKRVVGMDAKAKQQEEEKLWLAHLIHLELPRVTQHSSTSTIRRNKMYLRNLDSWRNEAWPLVVYRTDDMSKYLREESVTAAQLKTAAEIFGPYLMSLAYFPLPESDGKPPQQGFWYKLAWEDSGLASSPLFKVVPETYWQDIPAGTIVGYVPGILRFLTKETETPKSCWIILPNGVYMHPAPSPMHPIFRNRDYLKVDGNVMLGWETMNDVFTGRGVAYRVYAVTSRNVSALEVLTT
ncbi:hypothetical protein BDV95DRAFT_607790 [Massariosphaeria phaeospora]|uniref:Uncharacterized protein n=1 Tax=Massariosphaeria phaeospora TaxID=100035 RepID=A0A7C8M516_9PLEO|nr:hypothetical protein BDV95DRAFT_607790 [Massariosphaeria phaeospora]